MMRAVSCYLEGERTVTAGSIDEICDWLMGCEYVPGPVFFRALAPRIPVMIALTCLLACVDSTGVTWQEVTLSTDRQAYAVGDEVVLTLANLSGRDVRYSWCKLEGQQRIGDEWEHVWGVGLQDYVQTGQYIGDGRVTTGYECSLVELSDGATTNYVLPGQPGSWAVEAGSQYRLAIGLVGDQFEDRAVTISNMFEVAQ